MLTKARDFEVDFVNLKHPIVNRFLDAHQSATSLNDLHKNFKLKRKHVQTNANEVLTNKDIKKQ